MPVFTHTPMQADVWDMQGALIYFGSGSSANPNQSAMPTQYSQLASGAGPTNGLAPIVALGLQLSYGRGVSKRYPINIRRVIYTLGNPEGQITLNVLFGPNHSMSTFLQTFSAVGNNAATVGQGNGATSICIIPFGNVYQQGQGQGQASRLGLGMWVVSDPVIQQIGLQISEAQGANIPVTAQVSMMFTGLEIVG